MQSSLSYPLALIAGVYFYLIHQLLFLLRFGELNLTFNRLDFTLIPVGSGSAVLLVYFLRGAQTKKAKRAL